MKKVIKKKDLSKYKPKEEIEELVDADGTVIDGDDKQLSNDSEVTTMTPQTTDDFEKETSQHRDLYGYGGTSYSRGTVRVGESLRDTIENVLRDRANNSDILDKSDIDRKLNKVVKSLSAEIEELGADAVIDELIKKIKKS